MRKTVDLTGMRFGKLTVLENTGEQEENTCVEVLQKRKFRSDNTSGFRLVSKGPDGKWMVTIGLQRKRYYVGLYDDYKEAVEARIYIENALHTQFIETYQKWKQQALEDETWAQQNPFTFDVKKEGKNFTFILSLAIP